MESLNPNQRLAEATINHNETITRQNSLLQRAKSATSKPQEYDYAADSTKYAKEHVDNVKAQNKFITTQSQVKGSGKSPLATTMTPAKGYK